MKGFFKKTNPSDYVNSYIEDKKKRSPNSNTQTLKKFLFECVVSPIDTDVYGAILVLTELKLKRAYSSTFINNLTKQVIKVIHDKASESPANYNRYSIFTTKYEQNLFKELNKQLAKGKIEAELMQDDYYFRLIESLDIMSKLKEDLREVYYHHCPNKRPKSNNTDERVD